MEFLLVPFAPINEHRRSSFLPHDLDDRFACFSFSICCFLILHVDGVAHSMYHACCFLPIRRVRLLGHARPTHAFSYYFSRIVTVLLKTKSLSPKSVGVGDTLKSRD